MRRLLYGPGIIIGLFLILAIHLALIYILPYPFHLANFGLALLVSLILATDSGKVVWLGGAFFWCLELYTSSPYGVVLYAGTFTLLGIYWLYHSVITNRSLVAALALTTAAVVGYRALYSLLLLGVWLVGVPKPPIAWAPLLQAFAWEMVFTNVLMILLYGLVRPWILRLNSLRLHQL